MAQNKLASISNNYNEKEFLEFFKKFYEHADQEELGALPQKEQEAKAADAFKFLKARKPGQPKIEIFNPAGQDKKPRTALMVLNDNMPFLVDTVTAELAKFGLHIHEIYHPIIKVRRDNAGNFGGFAKDGGAESIIYLQITHIDAGESAKSLKQNIQDALATVYVAVEDWKPMLAKLDEAIFSLKNAGKQYDKETIEETTHFFEWLKDNHFTFLGYEEYDGTKSGVTLVESSKLGVFRSPTAQIAKIMDSELEYFADAPELLEITKSDHKAMVHRNVYMDQIGLKKFDEEGNVIGERWFVGLFASSAYFQTADTIPVIRGKVNFVLENSGLARGGHSAKIAQFVLDSYPRDEIFQSSPEFLLSNTMAIIDLIKRPRVGFFARRDRFDRFMSCLIYIPKEKMDTNLRHKLQGIIEQEMDAKIAEYYTQISDSPLSRLHLIVKPNSGKFPKFDEKELKHKITEAATGWSDQLMGGLFAHFGEVGGDALFRKYENAFSNTYKAANGKKNAIHDIAKIEKIVSGGENLEVEIYEQKTAGENQIKVKIFNKGAQLVLSDIMPMLENLGLRVLTERPYTIKPLGAGGAVHASEFLVEVTAGRQIKIAEVKQVFEEALKKIVNAELENDSLNRLVLFSHLPWRDVALLRSYVKYMKQSAISFGQGFVRDALVAQSGISALLVQLFYTQFDVKAKQKPAEVIAAIEEELKKVSSLSEDKILRWMQDTILATLRTNFFQKTGHQPKNYISIKMDAKKVPDLPLPRPLVEVFVYSPDVEGIHLRGGKVARGGLRWSDRPEDFRTEVLGLIKAQMVKNAVIVPVGSKGGFVVKKKTSEDREEKLKAGIECYKTFLRGILDITDNVVGEKIVPPVNVVRRDGDDPYLVVAADKGTASFSDIANSVSAEYNFWLGDAFASGGSAGYDHKAMAITARGGWISVMRHFHEMGRNSQTEDFTCVGIGDMAGDVFGNGMLLSKHIKLMAAFNHMHILLDPLPDAKTSFAERERLFKLPRSGWDDYDKSLISKGGGIFLRSAKSIKISPEVKLALNIKTDEMTPDELIRAILRAPVDLLWNGGIGTYVKATNENDRDVGDKNNDNLRINGKELRCKIIGEGGNLGLTQRGRVEAARAGVRLNTDAIDNSAGVDCSDHEVNIKIALAAAMNAKKLTLAERNKLLVAMTDEVAELVLRDNYLQTQALTQVEAHGAAALEAQASLIRTLEASGELNREIEHLPSDDEIAKLAAEKKGLTRPELSVLLAYSKISLYKDILDSKVPDEEYFREDLIRYFPRQMQKEFSKFIAGHQLRREIVATFIANSIINRTGPTFFHTIARDTDMSTCDIARAYTVARDAFGLRDLWREIEVLDGKVDYKIQVEMFAWITKFIQHMTFWFLRNLPQPIDVAKAADSFGKYAREFKLKVSTMLPESFAQHVNAQEEMLVKNKVPLKLAENIALLDSLQSACDVAQVTNGGKMAMAMVGQIYFSIGEKLSLGWLRELAAGLVGENYWQRLAARNVIEGLYEQQSRLAAAIIRSGKSFDAWLKLHGKELERHERMITELKMMDKIDISILVSAARRIESLGSV